MNIRTYTTLALILAVLVPTLVVSAPERVLAQASGAASCGAILGLGAGQAAATGGGGLIGTAAGAFVPTNDAAVTANTASINANTSASIQKEACLDAIAYGIANLAIDAIGQSVVNWIKSGFEGGPAFVTDLDAFLAEVDVAELEDFLGSDAIEFLCSPWKFDIQFSLALEFGAGDAPECSLASVVDNIDQFLAGDFSQGGWDGWFELSTRNNPYGDYLRTRATAQEQIAAARAREIKLLEFGRGFKSDKFCITITNPVNGETNEDCSISLPGAVAEEQLNQTIGSGQRRLEVADEINEIVTAFIAELLNGVLTNGLR